jgi:GH15 family glucan-1,4-alpha-glucosidase
MRSAPLEEWDAASKEIRAEIDAHGFDERRGTFVQALGRAELDAAVLLLPAIGFVDWKDERMLSTVDVLASELADGGLLRRYTADDGLAGSEGVFLACTFWLAECLARQDRLDDAQRWFDAAISRSNHLGLLSEEFDVGANQMIGNFPQGLSHYAHIAASLAIAERRASGGDAGRC